MKRAWHFFPAVFVLMTIVQGGFSASQPEPHVVRLDPALDDLVPQNARIEKLADGYKWVEGPVWSRKGQYLLFSDVPQNVIYKWKEGEGVSEYLSRSGYTGKEEFTGREPGSNGLAFDSSGRLLFCQHGDRQISRLEEDGSRTVMVSRYQGKRINSPNDLVVTSSGDLYFTDPPFGLPGTFDDPGKELPFNGVFRLASDGKLTLVTQEVNAPNGIAFSPDEKTLYISDPLLSVWYAFDAGGDGTVSGKRILFDGGKFMATRPGGSDGMKVDARGNIFGGGPGGLYIISPSGKLLGMLDFNSATGNCAWGQDGSTLFITAGSALYRIRLSTRGDRW